MNKKISSLVLLVVLGITDAYLLAHPNLIGRLGVLIYKHSYIKNFASALITVSLILGISLAICELLRIFASRKVSSAVYSALLIISFVWLAYVFSTFSTFSYRITGKAFIYGAHLLPVILIGLYGRYLVKVLWMTDRRKNQPTAGSLDEKV
ncbi:hypothetical protein [Dyadobacter psychrotolerans]|uniref:DUF4293 family protein n=1 Tax=Dyadobacter psychrotolerans TaxID=2541721 RepID=A0A4R5DMZ8_9BACT|nr:hypothetical protein [Dyadobacter psychrotolerans]TDE15686.1 hypothetical protein E0F88_14415 [Dyadobacter psychrotolerans]